MAKPLLVGMGIPPVHAAAACLVMKNVSVVFGAVGTPIWFRPGDLGVSADAFRSMRIVASVVQCIIAPVVVSCGLAMLLPWSEIRGRADSIGLVVFATVGASAAVVPASSEFPFIIPFLVVSLVSAPIVGLPARRTAWVGGGARRAGCLCPRLPWPALMFVHVMTHGNDASPVMTTGRSRASGIGAVHAPLRFAGAPLANALGPFFSGSATILNPTFGPV